MKTDEIVVAIQRLAKYGPALRDILDLPAANIEELIAVLADRRTALSLADILRSALLNRNVRRPPARGVRSKGSVDARIRRHFDNRKQFPTVPSMSRWLREYARVDLPPKKDSRASYVNRVVRALIQRPRLLERMGILEQDHAAAYKSLYRFIRES